MTTLSAPTYTQLPVQLWYPGETISFKIPAGTFVDPQGETLTYSASEAITFAALPPWLTFNPTTQTFSGTVPASPPARIEMNIFATDSSGLSSYEKVLAVTTTNSLAAGDLSPLITRYDVNTAARTPVTLTYSFMNSAPSAQFFTGENTGFQALSTSQQSTIKQALSAFSAVANITFTQVSDSSAANIRFGSDSVSPSIGYTAWDPTGNTNSAHVIFNNAAQLAYPFGYVALHELANVLHLADYSGASAAYISSFGLPAADVNSSYLVGSDIPNSAAAYSAQMGYYPTATPQLLDVLALQFLYGANTSGLTAGSVTTSYGQSYQFTDNTAPECIWVGSAVSGITSLDFSACTGQTIINLNPGSFSSTVASAPASWVTSNAYLAGQAGHPTQNIAIAYGTIIQEAIGNNAGDIFYANSGSDTLIGGTGNDIFNVSSGPCVVKGNGGSDVVVFVDARADYTIVPDGHGGVIVMDTANKDNGSITVYNVGKLQFADQTVSSPLPQITTALAPISLATHQTLSYSLPASLFTDPQGQKLTLSATLADGSSLPSWLSFDGTTFSGTIPVGAQSVTLSVTATDAGGLQMTDFQALTITIAPSLSLTAPSSLAVAPLKSTLLNGFQLADTNSQSASETVRVVLSDQTGALSAQAANGGQVSGSGTQQLTLSGTLAQVQAELAGVSYAGASTNSALTDTVTVSAFNSLGDSSSQTITITDALPNYLTGKLAAAVLSGATWHVVGTSTLAGSGTSGALVLSGGATLQVDGGLALGSGAQAGFIGNAQNGQATHGSLIISATGGVAVNNGGIYADSIQNNGVLSLVLNQPSFTDYATGQQGETLTIDAALTNAGTIAISSNNNIGGAILFEGGGTSSANAFIQGSSAVNSAPQVAIEFGGPAAFTLTGGAFGIYGSPTVLSGGTLDIAATTSFAHGLTVNGTVEVQHGTLVSNYDISGSGTVLIDAGTAVQILSSQLTTASSAADATLKFAGAGASLTIGTPSTFNGTLSSFAAGDTIDLAGTTATNASLSGGDLVITNGSSSVASIPITGVAAGTLFTVSSDGNGGSMIRVGESVSAALAASASAVVADSAANVGAGLDGLQALATAGNLHGIYLTDSAANPVLPLTAAQLQSDGSALQAISGGYSLSITAPSSSVTIAGLAGHADTVVFSGKAADYTITASGDGKSFTIAGDGVTDQVSGVTALQFNDHLEIVATKTAAAGGVSSAQVASLYAAVLARVPDVGGLAFYEAAAAASPATPIVTYAEYFLSSAEYTNAHNYAQSSAGDAQFITDTYQNLLGRAPEAGAVSFYQTNVINPMLAGLTSGTTAYANAELVAHATVLTYFSLSSEFLGDVGVTAQHPADATHWLTLI